MKTFGKLNFGIQAVQAGQKVIAVNNEPQLIANSTYGKFTITPAVSKALNIAVGENVMFLNNIAGVEAAVQAKGEDIRAIAVENGIDIDTKDGEDALIALFTQWYIAKGVLQYNSKGEPIMAAERYTKEDKAKYLDAHRMEIVANNREALIEQFGTMSDEELAEQLTIEMVESPKYHTSSGSKTSTSASTTGVGCQLGFTDSAIWTTLKKDLGDKATGINRVFNVLLSDAQTAEFNNGKENIKITILPIEFKEDATPLRGKKVD